MVLLDDTLLGNYAEVKSSEHQFGEEPSSIGFPVHHFYPILR